MKSLPWLAFVLQLVGMIALSVIVVEARRTERDLTKHALEAKLNLALVKLQDEFGFEIAADLPEDAAIKAQGILNGFYDVSGEPSLRILAPNGAKWVSAGASKAPNTGEDGLRSCTDQARNDKGRISTASNEYTGRLEVLSCLLAKADDEEGQPEKWYTFVVWASRPVPATNQLEIALGLAVFTLGLSLILTVILGVARQVPPPQPSAPSLSHPPAPLFSNTTDPAAFEFEAVLVPASANPAATEPPSDLVTIATIAIRRK